MSHNSKTFSFGLNIGSSSIILIFITLCLVSFATLSIVNANADKCLTTKVLERTTAYYEACNKAEETLARLDASLIHVYQNSPGSAEYFDAVGHTKSYTIPISDLQNLQINIEILYPETPDDTFYRITVWQVVTTGELQDESIINIQ